MKREIEIGLLTLKSIDEFFIYLNDHISDNGYDNSPLFLPISRNDLGIPNKLKASFRDGISVSIGDAQWRRTLIAKNSKNEIIGHVDLKSHNQSYSQHRAIMGMGVHRDYRQQGVGILLIESIVDWAKNETALERIDLWVLSENKAAIRLYEKLKFQKIAVIEDMFRIDGASLNYVMMTKNIS